MRARTHPQAGLGQVVTAGRGARRALIAVQAEEETLECFQTEVLRGSLWDALHAALQHLSQKYDPFPLQSSQACACGGHTLSRSRQARRFPECANSAPAGQARFRETLSLPLQTLQAASKQKWHIR